LFSDVLGAIVVVISLSSQFFLGTRTLTYADDSFTQYVFRLPKFEYDPRETKIQMQIRTRDPDGGVLMFNAGSEEGRFSLLEVTLMRMLCNLMVGIQ